MKVKARWAIKADGVWHKAGDVFQTENADALKGAVEVLSDELKPVQVKAEEIMESVDSLEPTVEVKASPEVRTTRTRKKTAR